MTRYLTEAIMETLIIIMAIFFVIYELIEYVAFPLFWTLEHPEDSNTHADKKRSAGIADLLN
jgi:hypothetical protein